MLLSKFQYFEKTVFLLLIYEDSEMIEREQELGG